MLNQRSMILAKANATPSVDPVPTGAVNAIMVENLSWAPANARMYQRNPVRVSQGKLKALYAGALIEVKFETEVKGSGAAGTAPEIGPLLRSCGMGETIVGATSVTYKLAPAAAPLLYFYLYKDGKLIKVTDACGKVTGVVQTGVATRFAFSFLGHYVSETDAALATPTYNAQLPIPAIGVPFVMDSLSTFAFTKFGFDLGNVIAVPDNIAAADGFGTLQIVDRNVTADIDPEDVLVATYNFYTKWSTNVAFALTTGLIGTVAGNKLQITLPAVSIVEQAPGDKGGIITRPLKLACAESASDDEISIIFT